MKQTLISVVVLILIGSWISEQAEAQRFSRRSRARSIIESNLPVRVTVPPNRPTRVGQPTQSNQPFSSGKPTLATPGLSTPHLTVYSWRDVSSKPFTADWYSAHPEVWQLESDASDPFVPATAGAVSLWLGATDLSSGVLTPPDAIADVLVRSGSQKTTDTQWMTLGVFALKPSAAIASTRVIHLAIDLDGRVRGSLADLLDGHAETLHGSVDKSTFQFAFQIGNEIPVTFSGSVAELTKPTGMLKVYFPGGTSSMWQLVRLAK